MTTLPPEVLARRAGLPRRPAPVELALGGGRIRLRPLDLRADLAGLHAISCGAPFRLGERAVDAYDPDAAIWRYMWDGPFRDETALGAWLEGQLAMPDWLVLAVLDAATGHPVGVACYLANVPEHLKIELGSIWYGPIAQRTGANREATYLMLRHAFGLGYRRVEWKANAQNARSRAAALAMGFGFEGVQDAHLIVKDRNRDTAWYRMLDTDWPEIEPRLRARIAV